MKLRLSTTAALGLIAALMTQPAWAQIAEAPSTVAATYRSPSTTQALKPGEKVGNLFHLNMETPYILQRLTQRTYWYQSEFYSTIFYVGDEGVLMFDPLEMRDDKILQSIRSVTNKPVTAIVYSPDHADHIADTPALLNALKGQALRLPQSAKCTHRLPVGPTFTMSQSHATKRLTSPKPVLTMPLFSDRTRPEPRSRRNGLAACSTTRPEQAEIATPLAGRRSGRGN